MYLTASWSSHRVRSPAIGIHGGETASLSFVPHHDVQSLQKLEGQINALVKMPGILSERLEK